MKTPLKSWDKKARMRQYDKFTDNENTAIIGKNITASPPGVLPVGPGQEGLILTPPLPCYPDKSIISTAQAPPVF
jgi:hypothetical protein